MFDLSFSHEFLTSILLHNLASNNDNGLTPIAIGHLPHRKSTISHYKITMQCIPARRKLSHNLQRSGLGIWGAVALMRLHILRKDRQLGHGTKEWRGHKWACWDAHFSSVFDLWVSMGAEATISGSATDTLKIGNDGRCFGPPPGRHLPEWKSG